MYSFNGIHPGPTITAETNKPVKVNWHSCLSNIHPLGYAIDPTLANSEIGALPAVRNTIHNHGAHVPNLSDGLPNNWITPGNILHYRSRSAQGALRLCKPSEGQHCTLIGPSSDHTIIT